MYKGAILSSPLVTLLCAGGVAFFSPLLVHNSQAAQPKLGQLNPTGRVITLPIILKESGGKKMGDLVIKIAPNDAISIAKEALIDALTPSLSTEFIASLKQQLANSKRFVPLKKMTALGLDLQFSQETLEMNFIPKGEQRPVGSISLAGSAKTISSNLIQPEKFSAYATIRMGLDYTISDRETAFQDPSFDLEFATKISEIVFETEGDVRSSGEDEGYTIQRRGSRLKYDRVEDSLRFQFGDTVPTGNGQNIADIFGLSVEKSLQALQPNKNTRPTSSTSFRLERSSTVDVIVNGNTVRTLRLGAGSYDLSDLQLNNGANDVILRLTNDLGKVEDITFSIFSGNNLLAKDVSEWSLTTGVRSRFEEGVIDYDFSDPVIAAFYRQGVNDRATGEVQFQADKGGVVAGVGVALQSKHGFMNVSGKISQDKTSGTGFTANVSWSREGVVDENKQRSSLRLAADYVSENFTTIGREGGANNRDLLRLNAGYSRTLSEGFSASLATSYAFANDAFESNDNNGLSNEDTYNVNLSLNKRITPKLGLGVTVGYSNNVTSNADESETDGEVFASLSLNYRIGKKSRLSGNYNSRTQDSRLSYSRQSEKEGVGSWGIDADVDHSGEDGSASVTGAFNYIANRADINLSHTAGFTEIDSTNGSSREVTQNTNLQIGTSIAFAGGKLAFGRPINGGGGFAIVSPHKSLNGSKVTVGTPDNILAYSSKLGPALVSGFGEYSLTRLSVDVDELPLGYDLGNGAFDFVAPLQAGFELTVGSDYAVSAYGTLLDRYDEPLVYISGSAYEDGDKKGRKSFVFTNKVGRFGAEGLAPGEWLIEMDTSPVSSYRITIPEDTLGLYKAGRLKPIKSIKGK